MSISLCLYRDVAFSAFMIHSDLYAFVVILVMYKLYVCLRSSLTPNILGVFSWIGLCIFVDIVGGVFGRVWSEVCASCFVRVDYEVVVFCPCV